MKSYDVIVIGAGHNGMVAAAKLAKSGKTVLVLEAATTYGGMATHGEFAPGFPGSPLVHSIHGVNQNLMDELKLESHGFTPGKSPTQTHCLSRDAQPLSFNDLYVPVEEMLGGEDESEWNALRKRLLFQASLLQRFLNEIPSQENDFPLALKTKLAKAAFDLKRAGKIELQEFLRMAMMCIADVADETLGDDRLKGLLAFDATLGIHLGPRSPTSLFGLYYRLANGVAAVNQTQFYSCTASQRFISALFNSAKMSGVEFMFNQRVKEIKVIDGAARSVVTQENTEIHGRTIISAIHPKTTFDELVGAPKLDTGFVRDISTIRSKGNVSKLNLVLDSQPVFQGIDTTGGNSRFVFAPSINHVENSFNPSKYGELPEDPCFEFVLEEGARDSFYLSIQIQNTPYDLKEGWESGEGRLRKAVLDCLETFSPGIQKTIIATSFYSPVDIEKHFHVPGGHWHHGELQLDRLFSLRPVFGAGNYRTSISSLYICGAGTHPGGSVTGVSGLNVAKVVLADWRAAI